MVGRSCGAIKSTDIKYVGVEILHINYGNYETLQTLGLQLDTHLPTGAGFLPRELFLFGGMMFSVYNVYFVLFVSQLLCFSASSLLCLVAFMRFPFFTS